MSSRVTSIEIKTKCVMFIEKNQNFFSCVLVQIWHADSPHQNAPECTKLHLKTQNFLGGHAPRSPKNVARKARNIVTTTL